MVRKFDSKKDYYSILGVSQSSKLSEIRKAHRRKVRKIHPDVNGGRDNRDIREINEAWEVLSDYESRAQYDGLRDGLSQEELFASAQRRREERARQEREREEETKRTEERRKKEVLIVVAKEIRGKLEKYFLKVPWLKERHFSGIDDLEGYSNYSLERKVSWYREHGVIFSEDVGVFDYFLNNLNPSAEELNKILNFTRTSQQMRIVLPLVSEQIEGMNLRLIFDNYPLNKIKNIWLGIVDDAVCMSRHEAIRTNKLDHDKSGIVPQDFCRFSLVLAEALKSGEYKMKLSQTRGQESDSTSWHGYWIDDLSIRGMPIIQDRVGLLDRLDLKKL